MNTSDLTSKWRSKGYNPEHIRLSGVDIGGIFKMEFENSCKALVEEELKFRDSLVKPICPCCGHGRTLFVHLQTDPNLVIRPLFSDWCDKCLKSLAAKMDKGTI